MTNEQMLDTAKRVVYNYYNNLRNATDPPLEMEDINIVWFCNTLQTWKAFVSTNIRDGVYYEVIQNGDEHEPYLIGPLIIVDSAYTGYSLSRLSE